MKNKFTILIVVILLLLLSFVVYLALKPEEKFKTIDLSNKNLVTNRGSKTYLDTIVQVGLDKLGIEGHTLMVKEQPSSKDLGDGFKSQAYIIYGNNQSIVFINKNINRLKAIKIISHELIHLSQYMTGRLQVIKNGYVVWERDTLHLPSIPYNERPWEIEAFNYGPLLEEDIKSILYERE